jgi:hypothetical protein
LSNNLIGHLGEEAWESGGEFGSEGLGEMELHGDSESVSLISGRPSTSPIPSPAGIPSSLKSGEVKCLRRSLVLLLLLTVVHSSSGTDDSGSIRKGASKESVYVGLGTILAGEDSQDFEIAALLSFFFCLASNRACFASALLR